MGEPSPANVENLRYHVALNGLENVRIEQLALSDSEGQAAFDEGPNRLMGRLHSSGKLLARTSIIDAVVDQGMATPDLKKVDVEGGELQVLRGARRTIAERRTIWLVALDDPGRGSDCFRELRGYKVREFLPGEIVAEP